MFYTSKLRCNFVIYVRSAMRLIIKCIEIFVGKTFFFLQQSYKIYFVGLGLQRIILYLVL